MLPDKQLLLDEVDGLSEIPDSTLESIATAGLIEYLQGTPLNPSLPKQPLVTAANPLQCLKRQEVLGLFVRKLLDFLDYVYSRFSSKILEWAMGQNYEFIDRTYDATNVIIQGTVRWPDLSGGTYTRTSKNLIWNTVDAYTITHTDMGLTIVQLPMTRDGSGNVTHKPPLFIVGFSFTPVVPDPVPAGELQRFDTLAAFRAATVTAEEVTLLADLNGDNAKFYMDFGSVAADDGVKTVIDAAGTHFTRLNL